jgi:hypothetical protein
MVGLSQQYTGYFDVLHDFLQGSFPIVTLVSFDLVREVRVTYVKVVRVLKGRAVEVVRQLV